MDIFYASCYNRPEKMTQHLKSYMLCLITGGFEYMQFYSESRKPLVPPVEITSPEESYLLLIHPETILHFSAGKKRENWVAMLDMPELDYTADTLQCFLNKIPLNTVIKVPSFRLRALRDIFSAAVKNFSSGHPAGREKASLQLASLLAELIPDSTEGADCHPAAAAMKKAIDEDLHFKYSLKELNDRLGGYSLPYMRKLFNEEYGIMPGKYRNILRMNRILELFAQSDLSLKMIADEVGMKHLPHLYAFLRSQQHLSPKELLVQLRGSK